LSETSPPETRAFEVATSGADQSRAAIPLPLDVRSTSPARAWARALEITAQATHDPARILPRAVTEWADKYGDGVALMSDRERLSFRALEARMNQYSRWALGTGVARSETVALMMGNRPEYFAIWLGLIQVGAIAALISPSLPASSLRHALKVAGVQRVIAEAAYADVCAEAVASLGAVELWIHGGDRGYARRIDPEISMLNGGPLDERERPLVTLADRALRIFTSGTTGFSKAAEVSHRKVVLWTHWFAGLAGMTAEDRLYNCLPMHHSVGGVVAVGAPLVFGGSVAIAERFSAHGFWHDVARWNCTAFQYIGELCRYLVAASPHPEERSNRLRLAIGNGLSPEVWRSLLDRLGPVRILEFYASTEGNVWLYNVEGKIGSVGRAPPYLALRDPLALARFDQKSQMPSRGPDGFCERCTVGEIGEALGRIDDHPGARFDGYSERAETEKKILRDVFQPGDAWMRTGDLMRRDADGFYTFIDRVGDTFRWKGENVATLEVSSAIRACPGVKEVLVYGVAVPGAEGRAGMALMKIDGQFDFDAFIERLQALPRYAWPLFVRLAAGEIETTETFKPKRPIYVAQGFDPTGIEDPLYVLDNKRWVYVPLDAEQHDAIRKGVRRL
jgi:fatty-acyl-CoA synthase